MKQNNLWEREGFFISSDKHQLQLPIIFDYLHNQSYWAQGIPWEILMKSIANSALCFGIYSTAPGSSTNHLVGFGRVITDLSTFAYLSDVFVLEAFRGKGLAKWLVSIICQHPDLQTVRNFLLITSDAHGLYRQFGFKPLDNPVSYMSIA
ncbi:MAG TPA: GNAT family N-acetyltransferase, partial [Syntrophomonas sp.]|nr:GNAT family N-acetyltransferase [Syntrophomonas sp.]